MKIEDDGHLSLGIDDPPRSLRPAHFTREARIAAWYARQASARITFVMPGRLEQLDHPLAAWG
jgi:hypothetical protein